MKPSIGSQRDDRRAVAGIPALVIGALGALMPYTASAAGEAEAEQLPTAAPADELAALYASYERSFGVVPPIPRQRIEFGLRVDPELTRAIESLRASALYNDTFDQKTTQLVAFGMLADNPPAAYWHAKAARQQGASWQELYKMLELAAMFDSGFGAIQMGGKVLADLEAEESGRARPGGPAAPPR